MEKGHLTYEELERYIDDTDFSEDYMMFCEPLMEHLDTCTLCRSRLDKLLLLSTLTEDENMAAAFNLVRQEEQIRRKKVALRLVMMDKGWRMAKVARRLEQGLLSAVSVTKADFVGEKVASHGSYSSNSNPDPFVSVKFASHSSYSLNPAPNPAPVTVHYREGIVNVEVRCDKRAEVTVILVPKMEKATEIMVAKACWNKEKGIAVTTFKIAQLEERYEIYVDEKVKESVLCRIMKKLRKN